MTVSAEGNDTMVDENGAEVKEYKGPAVNCYVCSSHPSMDGEDCKDDLNKDKIKQKSCPSGFCLKYIQDGKSFYCIFYYSFT